MLVHLFMGIAVVLRSESSRYNYSIRFLLHCFVVEKHSFIETNLQVEFFMRQMDFAKVGRSTLFLIK